MTQQEIIEGNKLIADFMGVDKCDRCPGDCGKYKLGSGIYVSPEEIKYHTSWNRLMPVVEKIGQMKAEENGTGITVLDINHLMKGDWRCHINYRVKFKDINSTHKSFNISKPVLIHAVWIAVTQFINWYNSINQQTQIV